MAGAITNLIAVYCWAKMFAYLVKSVTQKESDRFSRGTSLLLAGPIISIFFIILFFFIIVPDLSHVASLSSAQYDALADAFAIAPWIGYLAETAGYYTFYKAFRNILVRMDKGTIHPRSGVPPSPPTVPYEWRSGGEGLVDDD